MVGLKGGRSGTGGWPSPPTGFTLGEGGMPSVSRGVREPLWLRGPGTGGFKSGTGDGEDMVRGDGSSVVRYRCKVQLPRRSQARAPSISAGEMSSRIGFSLAVHEQSNRE